MKITARNIARIIGIIVFILIVLITLFSCNTKRVEPQPTAQVIEKIEDNITIEPTYYVVDSIFTIEAQPIVLVVDDNITYRNIRYTLYKDDTVTDAQIYHDKIYDLKELRQYLIETYKLNNPTPFEF